MHAKIYIPCEGVVNRVYSLQEDRMHKTVDDEVIFVFLRMKGPQVTPEAANVIR